MINDELQVSIDWLEFTVFDILIDDIYDIFGFDICEFQDAGRGGMGYRKTLRHSEENILIFYDGGERQGIHFRVSGASVSFFVKKYVLTKYIYKVPFTKERAIALSDYVKNNYSLLFEYILDVGQFTRIDLAIDDFTDKYFTIDDIVKLMKSDSCVSVFRKWENVDSRKIKGNVEVGHTVYFGSRKSDIFLRVYDKRLEQKVDYIWVRWELEIKNQRADELAAMIISKNEVAKIAIGLLSNCIRFIRHDDSNRSRCSLLPRWKKFVADVDKCKLLLPERVKTVEQKKEWFERQCMPTLAGILKNSAGDMSYIYNRLDDAYERNSLKSKMLFEGVVDYLVEGGGKRVNC